MSVLERLIRWLGAPSKTYLKNFNKWKDYVNNLSTEERNKYHAERKRSDDEYWRNQL